MGIEFDPTNLIVIAACIVVFAVQLLLCLLARRVFVRLIPTILAVLFAGGYRRIDRCKNRRCQAR